jgi:Zinc finger, C2H2 type
LCHMCHICSKFFRYQTSLDEHIKRHDKQKSRIAQRVRHLVTCDLCGFQTFERANLRKHIESFHLKIRPYVCPECPDKGFATNTSLLAHQVVHHQVTTQYQCSDCLRYYARRKDLEKHYRSCPGDPSVPPRGE